MKRGFTVTELFFWVAILAIIIGGFVYKNAKEFQKSPSERNIEQEGVGARAVDRVRIQNDLKSDYINNTD